MALLAVASSASASVSRTLPSRRGAAAKSSSTPLMALRTSPPQLTASFSATPSSASMAMPSRAATLSMARRTAGRTSAGETGLNSNTVLRLKSALYT